MELQRANYKGNPLVVVHHRCPICGLDYSTHACPTEKPARSRFARFELVVVGVVILLAILLTWAALGVR